MPRLESSLRTVQLQVMDALLSGDLAPAAPLIAGSPGAARDRLAVYRNNAVVNFRDALGSSFPAVRRLVGEDYFRQTAREFQQRHPSRSGDLLPAGAGFPAYLGELLGGGPFRYLADVARLEWLIQDALLAAGHEPLDLGRLAAVPPEDYDGLRFALHPSLRLFASPFPALRIWQVNVGPGADPDIDPEPVDLQAGADELAILNPRLELQMLRLGTGEAAFLAALHDQARFDAAISAAEASQDPAFDAATALRRFVQAGAIVDFR